MRHNLGAYPGLNGCLGRRLSTEYNLTCISDSKSPLYMDSDKMQGSAEEIGTNPLSSILSSTIMASSSNLNI